jgi:hypothetical protein
MTLTGATQNKQEDEIAFLTGGAFNEGDPTTFHPE